MSTSCRPLICCRSRQGFRWWQYHDDFKRKQYNDIIVNINFIEDSKIFFFFVAIIREKNSNNIVGNFDKFVVILRQWWPWNTSITPCCYQQLKIKIDDGEYKDQAMAWLVQLSPMMHQPRYWKFVHLDDKYKKVLFFLFPFPCQNRSKYLDADTLQGCAKYKCKISGVQTSKKQQSNGVMDNDLIIWSRYYPTSGLHTLRATFMWSF